MLSVHHQSSDDINPWTLLGHLLHIAIAGDGETMYLCRGSDVRSGKLDDAEDSAGCVRETVVEFICYVVWYESRTFGGAR